MQAAIRCNPLPPIYSPRAPDRAYVELDWSLLGLWIIQLFAAKEQIEIGEVPQQCSVSLAIHVARTTFQRWSERPVEEEAFTLRLQLAIKDPYQRTRSKQAGYHPNYKEQPSAGKPVLVRATNKH